MPYPLVCLVAGPDAAAGAGWALFAGHREHRL